MSQVPAQPIPNGWLNHNAAWYPQVIPPSLDPTDFVQQSGVFVPNIYWSGFSTLTDMTTLQNFHANVLYNVTFSAEIVNGGVSEAFSKDAYLYFTASPSNNIFYKYASYTPIGIYSSCNFPPSNPPMLDYTDSQHFNAFTNTLSFVPDSRQNLKLCCALCDPNSNVHGIVVSSVTTNIPMNITINAQGYVPR